jgi:2-C-methyl-D-erythritol 4-phosphate cytidylyltransferase
MKKFVLIVAGGNGVRMDARSPKQFLLVAGKPILMQTIMCFFNYDPNAEIVVVLPGQQIETWKNLCQNHSFTIAHRICPGGEKRFYSVKNGLSEIEEEGVVFIHDGVRPLVSNETLDRCFKTALQKGNAIPVVPVTESLRKIEAGKNTSVDRSRYFLVQTPQTFLVKEIKKAYEQEYSPYFTDDASVLEATGKAINLVDGNRENIKITYPHDLVIASSLLENI